MQETISHTMIEGITDNNDAACSSPSAYAFHRAKDEGRIIKRLSHPNRIHAAIAALMSKPVPKHLSLPAPESATEADLIRACEMAAEYQWHSALLDCLANNAFGHCPEAMGVVCQAWSDRGRQAYRAAAGMRATSRAGLRAKAQSLIMMVDPDCTSIDEQPLVYSILRDCAALAA